MENMAIGQVATYAELSEAGHYPPNARKYDAIKSIIETLKDRGMHFINIRNVGYQRISDDEAIAYYGQTHRKRLKSDTERLRDSVTAIDPTKLHTNRHEYIVTQMELSVREPLISKAVNRQFQQAAIQTSEVTADMVLGLIQGALAGGYKG